MSQHLSIWQAAAYGRLWRLQVPHGRRLIRSSGVPEQEMAGAEDDAGWMRDGAGELEAELAARQAELEQSARSGGSRGGAAAAGSAAPGDGGFDAQQLAERFKVTGAASTLLA